MRVIIAHMRITQIVDQTKIKTFSVHLPANFASSLSRSSALKFASDSLCSAWNLNDSSLWSWAFFASSSTFVETFFISSVSIEMVCCISGICSADIILIYQNKIVFIPYSRVYTLLRLLQVFFYSSEGGDRVYERTWNLTNKIPF